MSSPGKLICFFAWLFTVLVQGVVTARAPHEAIVFGVDISKENSALVMRGFVFICFGLFLSTIAIAIKDNLARFVALFSSALYLVHWFPFRSVGDYGVLSVCKSMLLLGSNPRLRLSYITRDAILPIAFGISIVLIIVEMRRSRDSRYRERRD